MTPKTFTDNSYVFAALLVGLTAISCLPEDNTFRKDGQDDGDLVDIPGFLGEDPVTGDPIFSEDGEDDFVAKTTITCNLYPTFDCFGVATKYGSGSQTSYMTDMNIFGINFRRMDMFAEICNPYGWVLHLSDSPTADGYGGDYGSTDHHAEGNLMNGTMFDVNSAHDHYRHIYPTSVQTRNAVSATGCTDVQMTAYHAVGAKESYLVFKNLTTGAPATTVRSLHGMKLGYSVCPSSDSRERSSECDWVDSDLSDQYLWYIGLNRVVNGTYRQGTGVNKACMVLDTNISASPASCL